MTAREYVLMDDRLRTLEANVMHERKEKRGAARDALFNEAMSYRDRREALRDRVLGSDWAHRLASETALEADELLLAHEA